MDLKRYSFNVSQELLIRSKHNTKESMTFRKKQESFKNSSNFWKINQNQWSRELLQRYKIMIRFPKKMK